MDILVVLVAQAVQEYTLLLAEQMLHMVAAVAVQDMQVEGLKLIQAV
jgi:hypothetical protein